MIRFECSHNFGPSSLNAAFEVENGITVLFGRSGAGKTTIINVIAGLLRPDKAKVSVGERTLVDTGAGLWVPAHKRRIGYIFQEGRLFPHLSVRGNLSYGARFRRQADGIVDFDKTVDVLGLGDLLDRRPFHLSGGEKQRVAIGRALLSQPEILLADEPLAALDQERKSQLLPVFERLRDEFNIPIVYVSHSANEVARLADTVIAMQDGKVLRQGAAADVLGDLNVLPLGPREAGAVLVAKVKQHADDGLTELSLGEASLHVPQVSAPIGTSVRVRIEAQDVMLATEKPVGISALNVMPALVTGIRMGGGPGGLVQVSVDGQTLLSRVTKRSIAALGLAVGQQVFVVAKSVSVDRNHLSH